MNICYVRGRQPLNCLAWILATVCGLVGFSGCGNDSYAPRYQVSGTVTYAGQPLPSGLVKFEPDVEKGGTGPGSYAPIKNGVYRTEEGVCAGPMKVSICGFEEDAIEIVKDGEFALEGTQIFKEYPTQAEIKNEDTVINFEVPEL